MDLGGKGYVGYQVNEDDSLVATPRTGHQEGLSLCVGHNYPNRKKWLIYILFIMISSLFTLFIVIWFCVFQMINEYAK